MSCWPLPCTISGVAKYIAKHWINVYREWANILPSFHNLGFDKLDLRDFKGVDHADAFTSSWTDGWRTDPIARNNP